MKKTPAPLLGVGLALASLSLLALPALAQEEETKNWSDNAEFAYVMTSGNSDSKTLGFKNTTTWKWERSLFELKLGGIRADSTTETFFAVGTEEEFSYGSRSVTEKTAENYFFDARYERKVTDHFFWYGGVGWERNRFAGIDNRYVAQAGVGNIWFAEEDHKFKIIRENYHKLAKEYPNVYIIDGNRPREEIFKDIKKIIEEIRQ